MTKKEYDYLKEAINTAYAFAPVNDPVVQYIANINVRLDELFNALENNQNDSKTYEAHKAFCERDESI